MYSFIFVSNTQNLWHAESTIENAFQKEELNAEDTAGTTISNPKFPVKVK